MSKELIDELSSIFSELTTDIMHTMQDYTDDADDSLCFNERYKRLPKVTREELQEIVTEHWKIGHESMQILLKHYAHDVSELMCKMAVEDANKTTTA